MAIQHTNTEARPVFSLTTNDGDWPAPSDVPRTQVAKTVVGVVTILIGVWGGLVPYIGHALNFNADGSALWTWNLQHGLLYLAPGIAAVAGGSFLVLSAFVDRVRSLDLSRMTLPFATVLLGLSGIWFLVGPSVWPIYYSAHVFAATSPVRTFAEMTVYNLAEGIILSVVAGVVGTGAVRALRHRPAQVHA
jgi:hypothetical protein